MENNRDGVIPPLLLDLEGLPGYLMKKDRATKITKKLPARIPIRFNSFFVVE
jgi:hypothetical protein